MPVLNDLWKLSTAEDFFHYFDVSYDPKIIRVARLHILKRMGETLSRKSTAGLSDDETRTLCRSYLQAAYAEFVERTPLESRVFKVLKQAVSESNGPLLPASNLLPRPAAQDTDERT